MNKQELQRYYQNKDKIESSILKSLIETPEIEVIYGARSVNAQLPDYLKSYTEDYDIYSENPEDTAKAMEKTLDKVFDMNAFEVLPAKHKGTFRVFSKVTGKNVADVSLPNRSISYISVDGVNYATLDEQVVNARKALADSRSWYRWAKDRDALQRIKLAPRGPRRRRVNIMKVKKRPQKATLSDPLVTLW